MAGIAQKIENALGIAEITVKIVVGVVAALAVFIIIGKVVAILASIIGNLITGMFG